MKRMKKVLCLWLAVLLLGGAAPHTAFASGAIHSGYCGAYNTGYQVFPGTKGEELRICVSSGFVNDRSVYDYAFSPLGSDFDPYNPSCEYDGSWLQSVYIQSYSDPGEYSFGRVKTIGERAFANAIQSGGSVHLGSDLNTIGEGAFAWMTNSEETDDPWIHHSVDNSYDFSADLCALILGSLTVIGGIIFGFIDASMGYSDVPSKYDVYGWDYEYDGGNYHRFGGPLTVTGGENVTEIRDYAFYNRELDVNHFPFESAETIGDYAFKRSFTHLDERWDGALYIPGATSVGEGAFADNAGLKYVCFNTRTKTANGEWYEEGLTELKAYTFKDCPDLESVVLPETLTTIRAGAFENCENLKTVYVPSSVTLIEYDAFPKNTTLLCEKGSFAEIYARGEHLPWATYNVDEDGKFTMETRSDAYLGFELETVLYDTGLGNSIRTLDIGEWARAYHASYASFTWGSPFAFCQNIETVLLSVGDCDFPEGMFEEAGAPTVTINAADVHISKEMFAHSEVLQNVTCNPGCYASEVGESAFSCCRYLETVDLGQQVRTIGSEAFYLCDTMTEAVYGDKAESVAADAFQDCFALYPEDSEVVARSGTFGAYNNLTWSFTYGGKLAVYGLGAMVDYDGINDLPPWKDYLDRIKTVDIGSGVTYIGASAFQGCTNLRTVTGGEGVKTIGDSAFYFCLSLGVIPSFDKVSSIGSYAFSDCEKLERQPSFALLSSLGEKAFYGCGLSTVVMPAFSTLTIGANAFTAPTQLVCMEGSAAAQWAEDNDYKAAIWSYDLLTKTLSIEPCGWKAGTGDFIYGMDAPWLDKTVRVLDVGEGIRFIGENAFRGMSIQLMLTAPNLENIKGTAFFGATVDYWDAVYGGDDLTYIWEDAIPEGCMVHAPADTYLARWLQESNHENAMFVKEDAYTMTISGKAKDWLNVSALAGYEPQYISYFNSDASNDPADETLILDSPVFELYGVTRLECLRTLEMHQTVPSWPTEDFSNSLCVVALLTPDAIFPEPEFYDENLVWCYPESPAWAAAETAGIYDVQSVTPVISRQPDGCHYIRYADSGTRPDEATFQAWGYAYQGYVYWEQSSDDGATWKRVSGSAGEGRITVPVDWDGPNMKYRFCVGCDWCDEIAYSNPAVLELHDTPEITGQPQNLIAMPGDTAAFRTAATLTPTMGDETLTYRWQVSAPVENVGWYDLPYAPDASAEDQAVLMLNVTALDVIPDEDALDTVLVRCKVTDNYGNVRYTEPASLTMSETYRGGSCGARGDNVTWRLENGVMTISGTGAMADYSFEYPMPWEAYLNDITTVVVENGVTTVGDFAFFNCVNLTSVTLPDTLTEIGDCAFVCCRLVPEFRFPLSLTHVGLGAFNGCEPIDVYYAGTTDDRWEITFDDGNEPLTEGAGWHYVNEITAANVTLNWTSKAYNGAVQKPTVTVKNAAGNTMTPDKTYTVSYSADSKVPGTYTVTVTGKGYYSGSAEKTYTITKQSIAASRVTLSATSYTYDGKVHKPTVTVKNAAGNTMTPDKTYTVSYSGNCIAKDTYTVTVTGKGYYTGVVTKTFTIK